jgi:hypothetical protein
MLEGECSVTGSMVVIAVFQIRKSYVDVINCEHTTDAVVNLFSILLKDFDNRYVPSEGGKVKYFREDEIGRGNRYVGVHQYFFFASFLDPRVLTIREKYKLCVAAITLLQIDAFGRVFGIEWKILNTGMDLSDISWNDVTVFYIS